MHLMIGNMEIIIAKDQKLKFYENTLKCQENKQLFCDIIKLK